MTNEARSLLNPAGPHNAVVDLEALQQTKIMIQRARIEHFRILAAKLSGDYSATMPTDPLFAGMTANGLPELPGEPPKVDEATLTFAQLVDRYLAFKAPGWEGKTMQAVSRALRNAMDEIGSDRQLKFIANTDIARFRDVLARVPPNFSKLKQFDGMPLTEVAERNDTGTNLSPKSQKKDLDFLHGFLSWGTEEGYLEKQPGLKIKIGAKKKGPPEKSRLPYDAAQLATIFGSPIFTGCRSESRRSVAGNTAPPNGRPNRCCAMIFFSYWTGWGTACGIDATARCCFWVLRVASGAQSWLRSTVRMWKPPVRA